MRIFVVYIIGAYIQSGPIKREIFVRPPMEWISTNRVYVWILTKPPYGVTENRRPWSNVIEGWLIQKVEMERVTGASQLFLKRIQYGSIRMILAKITDYLLFSGTRDDMKQFFRHISGLFRIIKAIILAPIDPYGCLITQS